MSAEPGIHSALNALHSRLAPAHIMFQFQNIPGEHRMNASETNADGYKGSEMRRYLTGDFLRGLVSVGAPEEVLYASTRYIANGGQRASAAAALEDWLLLPTDLCSLTRTIQPPDLLWDRNRAYRALLPAKTCHWVSYTKSPRQWWTFCAFLFTTSHAKG